MELGQLALQKGTSPQVKQFAQRMVTNQELMELAKTQNSICLPKWMLSIKPTWTDYAA